MDHGRNLHISMHPKLLEPVVGQHELPQRTERMWDVAVVGLAYRSIFNNSHRAALDPIPLIQASTRILFFRLLRPLRSCTPSPQRSSTPAANRSSN